MEQFNNVDKVHAIINEIVNSFSNVIKKYEPHHHGDAYSYFLEGHCTTFIQILYEIFDGNIEVYNNPYHVIAKIGENFYDVTGVLHDSQIVDYKYIEYEYMLYLEDVGLLGNSDKIAKKIIPDLVEIGKKKSNEIFEQLENNPPKL